MPHIFHMSKCICVISENIKFYSMQKLLVLLLYFLNFAFAAVSVLYYFIFYIRNGMVNSECLPAAFAFQHTKIHEEKTRKILLRRKSIYEIRYIDIFVVVVAVFALQIFLFSHFLHIHIIYPTQPSSLPNLSSNSTPSSFYPIFISFIFFRVEIFVSRAVRKIVDRHHHHHLLCCIKSYGRRSAHQQHIRRNFIFFIIFILLFFYTKYFSFATFGLFFCTKYFFSHSLIYYNTIRHHPHVLIHHMLLLHHYLTIPMIWRKIF